MRDYKGRTNNSKEVCKLVNEAYTLALVIRGQIQQIIVLGYEPSETSPFNPIVEELQKLLAIVSKIQALGSMSFNCATPIDINNAVLGINISLRNIEYISMFFQRCPDTQQVFADTQDVFCTFTLGTLAMLEMDCNSYVENKSMKRRCSYGENEIVCKPIRDSLCRAINAKRIIAQLFEAFTLEGGGDITPELQKILEEEYRVIENECQFALSQSCTYGTFCSPSFVEGRLIKVKNNAAFMVQYIASYDFTLQPCMKLRILQSYLLTADIILAYLEEVVLSIPCNKGRENPC